jgi:hypothetical protein
MVDTGVIILGMHPSGTLLPAEIVASVRSRFKTLPNTH